VVVLFVDIKRDKNVFFLKKIVGFLTTMFIHSYMSEFWDMDVALS